MAGLFGSEFTSQQPTTEVDPAAEFLAQQENEIAGLESDVLGGFQDASAIPPPVNGISENMIGDEASNDDFFNATATIGNEQAIINGAGDFENGGYEDIVDQSQPYVADTRYEQIRLEPEKIRLWREENTKLLAEKDRESERRQQEWLAQARKELEDWDRNRQEQLEKTKEGNRIAEEQFVKDRDQNTPGSEWERVSKLCDFNPKVMKGSKDVTRMRSTLLHLKQNPRPVSVPEAETD